MLFPLFFAAVYLAHITLLRLPYFWDEAGYYIPAAWDFYRTGSLIPQTALTNAHPPMPSVLLAGWWHLSGFVVSGTRTLVVMVASAALVAVYKLGRSLLGTPAAIALVALTAIYPVWFAQSTLAHADIFAACFTLWGLALYFDPKSENRILVAAVFCFAVLSKETAIFTAFALALFEAVLFYRSGGKQRRSHALWIVSLLSPALPLAAWYAYHRARTGFIFGNPLFLRYNATANLDAHRIAVALGYRLLHLATHMNMFVPVAFALAALLLPVASSSGRQTLTRRTLAAIFVVLLVNWIALSVLGGALLARYLLPLYPLVLLLCIAAWRRHFSQWIWVALASAAAFLCGLWINPLHSFSPEDNLTYRDMIVLHQQAIHLIEQRYPDATVLSAWPATEEMGRPEMGYTSKPIRSVAIENFTAGEVAKAAADPGAYDTALIFTTKWEPAPGSININRRNEKTDMRYFDLHHDLTPEEAARVLHGEIVWQGYRKGEWAAVLRFPRAVDAQFVR